MEKWIKDISNSWKRKSEWSLTERIYSTILIIRNQQIKDKTKPILSPLIWQNLEIWQKQVYQKCKEMDLLTHCGLQYKMMEPFWRKTGKILLDFYLLLTRFRSY